MRHLPVIFVLFALALAAGVDAARAVTVADGTLSVKNGDGLVGLRLERGAVIGRVGRGSVTVIEPLSADCDTLLVWEDGFRADGDEVFLRNGEFGCKFTGRNIRYRIVGGETSVDLKGWNISVSVVGRGSVLVRGKPGALDDGRYSLNGGPYESLPDVLQKLSLGA